MTIYSDAYERLLRTERPVLLSCSDDKRVTAVRASCHHMRRKFGKAAESVYIRKVVKESTDPDKPDQLFIELSLQAKSELYEYGIGGKIVPASNRPEDSPELQRQLALMRKDGCSDQDILKAVSDWEDKLKEEEGER